MAGSTSRDTLNELEDYELTGGKIARIYVMDSYNGKPIPEMNNEKHIDELTEALVKSGFEVEIKENFDEKHLKKYLKSATTISGLACLWIFIFSKFNENGISCFKGVVTHDKLLAWLKPDKCNNLLGKPKMLFVQAELGEIDHYKNEEPLFNMVGSGKVKKEKILPLPADITMALFKRKETDRKGRKSLGLYINEELKKKDDKSIFDIMTSINGKGWKIAPTFCTTFRKQLILSLVEESSGTASTTSLEQYTIHGPKKAYFFVFKDFEVKNYKLKTLEGADADKGKIADAMEKLGFNYEDCNKYWTLTVIEMKEKLKEIAKNEEDADCVMIFVSTHGIFEKNKTKMFAYDGKLDLSDLWTAFDEFDGFRGKPKIIIYDGCRGGDWVETMSLREEEADHGQRQCSSSSMNRSATPNVNTNAVQDEERSGEIPDGSDVLIGLASVKDICEKLTRQDGEFNLLDVLISANGKEKSGYVKEEGKDVYQMPAIQSSLRKKFILKKCENKVDRK